MDIFFANESVCDDTNTTHGNGSHTDASTSRPLQHPPLFKQSVALPLIIFLCVAYTLIFLLSLINNSLVLTVIYKNSQMRSITNYFLANLATADITVSLIVLPITLLSNILTGKQTLIHTYWRNWPRHWLSTFTSPVRTVEARLLLHDVINERFRCACSSSIEFD